MDSKYMQSVVAEFVGQLVDISKQKQRSYAFSNKIADFGDIFIDYLASEVVNHGYFYYNSNKKYAECDENEKEWAINIYNAKTNYNREDQYKKLYTKKCDAKTNARRLEDVYLQNIEKLGIDCK